LKIALSLHIIATLVVGVSTWRVLANVITMEAPSFSWLLRIAFTLSLGGAAYLAASAFTLWHRLRRLLRAPACGPLSDAFDRVARAFCRRLGLRWSSAPPAASELRYDMDQVSMLRTLVVQKAASVPGGTPSISTPTFDAWDDERKKMEEELTAVAAA